MKFSLLGDLNRHKKDHTGPKHKEKERWKRCDKCGIIFSRIDQLLSHINLGLCSNTTDNHGASSSSQSIETNTGHIPTRFVDCGPTIKEEIKEENVEFHDPLRLSYAVFR